MSLISGIKDRVQGKTKSGERRSSGWSKRRKAHLASYPHCAVCGGVKKTEVHHKVPFHVRPDLELDPLNLLTLCESKKNGINCHLAVGHAGNYRAWNPEAESDAKLWKSRIKGRLSS